MSSFLFVPTSTPLIVGDIHPCRDDSSALTPDCCVEGCELEGLHLREDQTLKTNPKYFCNKHKKRILENHEWVKNPEGGFYKFNKIFDGKRRRPRKEKDRLQTNKQSKAAGKRKKEEQTQKIAVEKDMKINDLEKENVDLKSKLQTALSDILVKNKIVIELQETIISLSVANLPPSKKQCVMPSVAPPLQVPPPAAAETQQASEEFMNTISQPAYKIEEYGPVKVGDNFMI